MAGKVIVVAGGAGRIGQRFCAAIAGRGGSVIVADVSDATAGGVAASIRDAGGRAESSVLDITSPTSVDALIASVLATHGRIDAVVNSAYPRNENWGRKFEEVTYADFCENTSLHLGGFFLVTQRFAIQFRAQGGGNIVNIGSIYGVMAPRFELYEGTAMTMPVEYAAIKSAVLHVSRYVAQYYKRFGVRCNVLSPGGVRAAQPEEFQARYGRHAGRTGMLEAGDLEGALVFLLSDDARHITGQNLVVDDGFSL